MTRPWFLSRILVVPAGINGLGGLEAFFAFLPLMMEPLRHADAASRSLTLITGLTVVIVDAWWRVTGREKVAWLRAISPYEGGAVVFVPGWLFGLAYVGLVVFTLVTATSNPYAR